VVKIEIQNIKWLGFGFNEDLHRSSKVGDVRAGGKV